MENREKIWDKVWCSSAKSYLCIYCKTGWQCSNKGLFIQISVKWLTLPILKEFLFSMIWFWFILTVTLSDVFWSSLSFGFVLRIIQSSHLLTHDHTTVKRSDHMITSLHCCYSFHKSQNMTSGRVPQCLAPLCLNILYQVLQVMRLVPISNQENVLKSSDTKCVFVWCVSVGQEEPCVEREQETWGRLCFALGCSNFVFYCLVINLHFCSVLCFWQQVCWVFSLCLRGFTFRNLTRRIF